jgi:hypothetical protein
LKEDLFDLGFFVDHVLAGNRVELLDFHFLRHCSFVFGRGIKVTGAFGRDQFDFIAHFLFSLHFMTAAAQVGKNRVDAFFVDDPHTFGRNSQAYPAVFAFDPKSVMLQIRQKTAVGFIVRM